MTARSRLDTLLAAGAFGPLAADFAVVETHVSWVVLNGDVAYKVKKPVNLGFLDFSSLAARRHACEEELRLNRRLAPDLYLDVVALRIAAHDGEPDVEYAVRMRRFPRQAAVGAALADSLTSAEARQLGRRLGEFHQGLPASGCRGGPEATWAAIDSSLTQMAGLRLGAQAGRSLQRCREFLAAEFARRRTCVVERQRGGAVRECHGDLHLGNLVRLGDRVLPFDALEFDPSLRWTDVMNEMAFLVMDLDVRGHRDLAFDVLNAWLEVTGDFAGLAVLRLYLSYRALVRAKVRALAPAQAAADGPGVDRLLDYAAAPLAGVSGLLVLMSGVSGSGKSWLAERLSAALPAVHLRSDVERKRLFGLPPLARTGAPGPGAGIYAPEVSARVYARLADQAAVVLAAGLPAILDATNLRREHRAPLLAEARRAHRPCVIVACGAGEPTLAERVATRARQSLDASEATVAVLRQQLQEYEPPRADEADAVLSVDTTGPLDVAALARRVAAVTDRLN